MLTTNPYRIEGPALISFSGGRTSAYMLWHILQAHGGTLPDDAHVVFANTGKEREETLRFVHECATRWGVRVRWLEWQDRRKKTPVDERFEEVGYNSAARAGEPFKALIASKKAVPNAVQRWCTTHLKWQVCADFMEAMGYPAWANVVGLRADEPERTTKKRIENATGAATWQHALPLDDAGVRKSDVLRFWLGSTERMGTDEPQGFDLRLNPWEGNCTKCMMKGRKLLMWEVRRDPVDARDWSDMEWLGGGTFTTEWSMDDLIREARSSPLLPILDETDEYDAECGTWCMPAVRRAA